MNDLGSISSELKNEPESLRTSILSGMAKLKGLDLLTGANAFQRDQARLDARQRAIYRKQGVELREEDDVAIHNILADNITIQGGGEKEPSQTPSPSPSTTKTRQTHPLATTALVLGSVLTGGSLGGLGMYLANQEQESPPAVVDEPAPKSVYKLHLLD